MRDERLTKWAGTYGTPCYVYDAEVIERQYARLKAALPDDMAILYSVKANPLIGVCQWLRRLGAGCEVASEGELLIALAAGFEPESIHFAGPGKTAADLRAALASGIGCVHLESVEEARLLNALAAESGRAARVALRVNPDLSAGKAALRMGGAATPFGIDRALLDDAVRAVLELPLLDLAGFHFYAGSQLLDADAIAETFRHSVGLACELARNFRLELRHLDVGGGFGVPYFPNEKELDLNRLSALLAGLTSERAAELKHARLYVESGRFLLAESGVYLTRVLYRKTSKGRVFLVCDGGSHHHANSAFLGRFVRGNFPLRVVGKQDGAEEVDVVGPLCTPTDCLAQGVRLPRAEPGDLIAIEKSGAYGLTNSPSGFLSHPLPAELLALGGEALPLRERGRPEDALRGQRELTLRRGEESR